MDIVVKGRNVEVPDHYREHVADKISKVERYDQKLIRADVCVDTFRPVAGPDLWHGAAGWTLRSSEGRVLSRWPLSTLPMW